MKIKSEWKKLVSTAAAVCLTAGSVVGLAGYSSIDVSAENQEQFETAGDESGKAMGRYLEKDVSLPEGCTSTVSMHMLDNDVLRIAYRDSDYQLQIADSDNGGESWENKFSLSEKLNVQEGQDLNKVALAGDGGIFASVVEYSQTEGAVDWHTYYKYLSPQGEAKELDLGEDYANSIVTRGEFSDKGTLFIQITKKGVLEIDMAGGSVLNSYEEGQPVNNFGIVGNTLMILLDGSSIHYYDAESGKPIEDSTALTQQIASNPQNMEFSGNQYSYPILFTGGDEEGSLFYVDRNGLYRYAFGGSVVEQIIDGGLNSIGSPSISFISMVRASDEEFYLMVEDFSSGNKSTGKILRYVYSKDTPSVPDTEIKVYALNDSSFIRQAADVYQKNNPDVYIDLQIGRTDDEAVTSTDALKVLNTEIMAGKGPDILILDDIPADNYIEKGVLTDMSGLLKEDSILENIKNAYIQEDGSIYALPIQFAVPMLQGKQEFLENIEDLKSMADVIEAHAGEYSANLRPLSGAETPELLLRRLADVSAAAWVKEDGTLDKAALTEYLTQAERIYKAGQEAVEQYLANNEIKADANLEKLNRSLDSMAVMSGSVLLGMGNVSSPDNLAYMESVNDQEQSLTNKLWRGQGESSFMPMQVVGISAKAQQKEAAEAFIRFLFSKEGQLLGRSTGLPVNQEVYDDLSYWITGNENASSVISVFDNNGGAVIDLEIKEPSQEEVQAFQEIGKSLTVPSGTNEVILNAVTNAGVKFLNGEMSLDGAASDIIQQVNIYLSE